MTHSVEDAMSAGVISKLKNEEPVLASAGVLWVLAQLGTVLVGHKIIGTEQWTSLTNTVAPIAITAILGIVAWVTRNLVDSPKTAALKTEAINVAQSALANGVLRAADFDQLSDWVISKLNGLSQPAGHSTVNVYNPPAPTGPPVTTMAPPITSNSATPIADQTATAVAGDAGIVATGADDSRTTTMVFPLPTDAGQESTT